MSPQPVLDAESRERLAVAVAQDVLEAAAHECGADGDITTLCNTIGDAHDNGLSLHHIAVALEHVDCMDDRIESVITLVMRLAPPATQDRPPLVDAGTEAAET